MSARRFKTEWIAAAVLLTASRLAAQTQFHSWTALYDGPAGLADRSVAVAADDSGNFLLAGTSRNSSGNDDLVVAKLAKNDGALLWERRYDGPGPGTDRPVAITLDALGNPVVAGVSVNASGSGDILAIKLDGTGGNLLWERRIDGDGAGEDVASSIGIDPAGNVLLCGSVRNTAGNDDFYVAKLSGAAGTVLWTFQENGQGSAPHDRATALGCGTSGDWFVTGYRRNGSGNDDFFTVKLSGDTGTKVWEALFNGAANGRDRAVDLGLDAQGDVVVTGNSRGTGGSDDFQTLKLSGLDGSVLWTASYNGPANDRDTPAALVVDEPPPSPGRR